jgi:hypothetical protein
MSMVHIKPGSKHVLLQDVAGAMWREPVGNPNASIGAVPFMLTKGSILTAGLHCITHRWAGPVEGQWFSSGPSAWHVFVLQPGQKLLKPLDDYGPMGALVIDDPSGEDVCADA